MLLIKNDPKYNEQWPRPLVSYERLYGVKEPKQLVHKNDGKRRTQLPEGTPFGLVGTSSMYKRESAPGGAVPEGSVTAVVAAEEPELVVLVELAHELGAARFRRRPVRQQRDSRDSHRRSGAADRRRPATAARPRYGSHGIERLRILGEIPVRKFAKRRATQPLDPDGNPDTSFLAKIPADQSFTFQLIDKDGMMLNMAQTWHQVRPGEARNDCGGCHAHSQKPTPFEQTAAAQPDYQIFDLTRARRRC